MARMAHSLLYGSATHLGCKVHDGVDLLCLEHMADEICALDVCLDELRVKRQDVSDQASPKVRKPHNTNRNMQAVRRR